METRAKLPKKVLSMFLSLLMALSCFSVALPGIVPTADASTTAQWTALQNAFDAAEVDGILTGSTITGAVDGTSVTINDAYNGHVYKIADLLYAIVQADYASYTHHERMASYVKGKLTLNDYQKAFVDTLLPSLGNYQYSSTNDALSTGWNKGSYPASPLSGNITLTVTITRSLDDAINMDCDTADKVPANINTTLKYSVTAAPTSANNGTSNSTWTSYYKDGSNEKTTSVTDTYYKTKAWYTNSGAPSVTYTTTACPDLSAIVSYLNYVNAESFQQGYNAWRANPTIVYSWEVENLEKIETAYTPYTNALAGVDQKYVNRYIGTTQKGLYDEYTKACTGAVTAAEYYPIIEWIRDGVSLEGYLDRDSYEDHLEVRKPENKAYLEALLADANSLRAILQACDLGTTDAFANVYGYTDAMFVEYLNIVIGYLEIYETTDMYDVLTFRMSHDETECYNGDPSLWGVKNYLSYPYTQNGEECPVDDEMLAAAAAYFNGAVGAMESYNIENVEGVFAANGDITFAEVQNMRDELNKEVSYRGHEVDFVDFYTYFESVRHERYNLVSFKSIANLIVTAGAKADSLSAYYANAVATFGEERAKQIYGNYPATIEAFIDSLYDILLKRSYDQHFALLSVAGDIDSAINAFDGTQADEVTNANFSAVKRAVKGIDLELYEWVLANCSGATVNDIRLWHGFIPEYEAAAANVIAQAWSAFKQIQLDSPAGSGYYTTRYATEGDMVREEYLDSDDYVVTEAKINTVISKLDGFITSEAFTKLLGVYRETAEPELDEDGNPTGNTLPAIHTLSEYIENLLHDMLFQDELINTIVSALFPMLTELIGGLIGDLFQPDGPLKDTGMLTQAAAGADGAIDLGKLEISDVDELTGKINVHLDGNKGTARLYNAFAELGLSFYPVTFAAVLEKTTNGKAGKYNALITNLKKAGEDWNNMDLYGNADGELTVEDFEAYSWGVTDYDTFCIAIGDVFTSILPLLQVLFTNRTYNCTASNLIYGTSDSIYVKKVISATVNNVTVWGDLHLALNGVQGYNNVWGTLFETLGITATTSGYGVGQITAETPLSTTFGTSADGATAAQFANALFAPLLSLVDKVAEKPIDTVMSIIPNLMQSVSYGFVQPLLGALSTSIGITATLHDLTASGGLASWLVDLLQGTVCDLLSGIIDFNFDLNLGELLDLQELLGVEDLADINGIIDHFLLPAEDEEAEGEEGAEGDEPAAQAEGDEEQTPTIDYSAISIPAINAGQWASLGEHKVVSSIRTQNLNDTTLSAGQRHTIVADKPDMLYSMINWLLEFAAGEGNVSGLLATFGMDHLGAEVDAILAGIDADDAVAALIELFLPQDYSLEDYAWYQSNGEGSRYNLSSADFVYLKYANDWTREKADYIYHNVDSMANSIINMIDPDMLAEHNGNVNEYILDMINGAFDNEGVMNVINLVVGIGESLAGQDMIVNLIKDQLSSGVADAGVDLLTWYRSFGYLLYDYTPKYDEETGELIVDEYAPLKPDEAGYVNEFPMLDVEVVESVDADGNTVKEFFWSIDGVDLVDNSENAREVFTSIFCELFKPFSPIIGLLFTGTDLALFNGAIVINGAKSYQAAIIPALEMLGIYDLKTQEEYEAAYLNDSAAGFEYLVNKLFDRVTELLTIDTIMVDGAMVEYGPVQKVVEMLPQLFYFIQSNGIATLLKNLLHPLWSLVDTIRPLVDVNLDAAVHQILTGYLGLVYDKNDTTNYPSAPIVDLLMGLLDLGFETPEYSAEQAAEDKDLVDGIFNFSVEKLDLNSIFFVVETMFGIDLSPFSYAIEGMCLPVERDGETYGLKAYQSKTGKTAYTLDYYGSDVITVLFSTIFDVLLYEGNAEAVDKLLGFVNEIAPGEDGEGIVGDLNSAGLIETIVTIFKDKADDMGTQPNWDYLLENKVVFGKDGITDIAKDWVDGDYQTLQTYSDLSMYHSINALQYYTDWTEDTAKATDELLKTILDFVVTMIDEDATDFGTFIEELLMTEVFAADTVEMLVDLIADLFAMIPVEIITVVDTLLGVNLIKWADYVEYTAVLDENGDRTGEYEWVARDLDWFDVESEDYIDTKEEFLAAIAELLTPAAKVLGVIFLGTDYRLFHSIDKGPGSVEYGKDSLVINGLNAYAKGIVPIFEALGLDLQEFKPEKYNKGVDANGNMLYNEELFVSDFVQILSNFIDMIAADPVNWLVDNLPGLIYFINANGLSVSVMNIVDSLIGVLDVVNTMLDDDQKIDLTNLAGINVTELTLEGIFGAISSLTGIVIRGDLQQYLKTLYVGQLKAYTSANGQTAFTMEYSAVEQRHDMITILLSLLVEIASDEGTYVDAEGAVVEYNNAQIIDDMINGDDEEATDYVSSIIGILKNPEAVIYKDINWNYFDEDFDLTEKDEDGKLLVPGYAFQYLNYTTDWTYQSAAKTAEGFSDLLLGVLKMTGVAEDGATLSETIKGMLNLESVFTGETLQSLLDLVSPLLFGEDAILNQTLIEVIGAVLGADLTQWNNEYAFESLKEGETYELDAATGLQYRMADIMEEVTDENGEVTEVATGEKIKTYAITTREEFITGSIVLFQPAYRLLAWLLFGDSYEFFNGNTEATADDVLITIPGSDGYANGLALLLEALGCTGLGFEAKYKTVDADGNINVDMELFVKDLMTSLFTRIDEILNDPANELVNLIPELLYFINAGGLQVSIANLVAGPLNLVNTFAELIGDESLNVDVLLQDLLRDALDNEELVFTLDSINLGYIFDIVEMFTGLEISDVAGNKLQYFYMGEIVPYASAGGRIAYKMRFSSTEDFADFITILLSFLIDVALWDGNAAALEELLGLDDGLVSAIVAAIKESYTIEIKDIDWFYFDESIDSENFEVIAGTTTVDLPDRTINYITGDYLEGNNLWNKETVDYIVQNIDEIIAAVLSMTGSEETSLGEILANSFSLNEDLYTADNLNSIIELVTDLVGGFDSAITDLINVIIGVDLSAYNNMALFTEEEITDRESFVNGLYQVVRPIFRILDWLLFGDDIEFFDKKTEDGIETFISLPGGEGYAYAIVPLFEALGAKLPAIKEGDKTEDLFYSFANNLLARVEAILNNPIEEALALLPNLLYFINANGVSTVVNNLAGGILNLLDVVNEGLADEDKISIEKFLADALGMAEEDINIDNIDLLYIVGIAEEMTGLELTEMITEAKIDNFYLGQLKYYTSANGKPAFRMEYSATEGPSEMLTILVNFVLETALYVNAETGVNNPAALEKLLGLDDGTIVDILEIIPTLGATPNYVDYNWNYMGGTIDDVTYDITLPKTPFINYFTYKTDVTQEVANYFYDNLDQLVLGIMRMCGEDETLEEMLAGSFNLYSADILNDLVGLTEELYNLMDKKLIEVAGVVLDIDVAAWDGLVFTDAEIYDRDTFAAGLTQAIAPLFRILDWLLFGDSIELFVKHTDGTEALLTIAGNEGYKYGLAPLLEAIGVDLPTLVASPSCATMFRPVIDAVLERYDEIMVNIIDAAVELLPNLLYFINANGLSVAVRNLAGPVLNVIDVLNEKGIADIDLSELLFGIDINNVDLEAVFTLLEDLEVLGDFEFNNAFRGYMTENADGTVTFTRDITGENIIKSFYLGDVDPYVSSTGDLAYRMHLTEESRGDIICFLLSFAVDAVLYGDNAGAIERKFDMDEGIISNIAAIFAQKMEFTPADFNWVYFLELSDEELDAAIDNVLEGKFNELPELPERTLHYVEYDNNWTEEAADYLVSNLPSIVDLVIAMSTDYASLSEFINGSFNLYTNENVNMIVEALCDLLSNLDEYVLNHAGVLLNVEVEELMNFKATDVTDKASFVKALATAIGTMGEIVDLVLFGEDLELFTTLEDGSPALLTATGGEGYVNGLAPLLSALGVDTNIGEIPAVDGDLSITEQVIETILLRICDRVDELLANPVDEVIDLLLNLFYFINADGLTVAVNNLLQPATYIMEGLGLALNEDYSWNELFGNVVDINDLSFEGISALLYDLTGINLWGAVGDYLGTFYFGELEYYEYAEGKGAFRMVYTDEEEAHDFITILLSIVLDTFVYEGNKDALVELFGDEAIYNVIMAFLTDAEVEVPMRPYEWIFTDKADTGIVLSPVTGDGLYDYMYGELYTREMGEYITYWLPEFIDTMIALLGVESPDGDIYDGLQDMLNQLIGTTIYKTDLLVTIYDAIAGLVADLKEGIGEELFTHLAKLLDSILGVNLAYWDNYTVAEIAEGDKEAFINELLRMLNPVYPLLAFLLTDEDLAFFNKDDGIDGSVVSDENSYVIIQGAEGYAYGILPILEAFGYDNDAILTPAEYKAAADGNPEELLRNILNPLLNRVDEILADPIDELLGILPGVIYFVNSNGLDTAINNTINAVIRVLETIEPLTGEIDLYELIGFDFDINIEGLITELLEGVAEDTGFELTEVAMEAITELTLGEVISYTSKNGDKAYTMKYATGADSVDFVTVILRLVLTFISIPENVVALEAILADELTGDGYTFLCSLLENFSQMVAKEKGMDEVMYTVYQIFYAANVAAHKVDGWVEDFNGDYSFLNQLFATSDLAFLRQIESSLSSLLNKYAGDILDEEGVAPNGFIKFFQKIAEFFQKIADFFANLFK